MTDQTPQPQPAPADQPSTPTPVWAPPSQPQPVAGVAAASSVHAQGPRRRSWIDIFLVVGAVVALAGIGFAVGRLTAPTTTGFGQRGQFNVDGQFPGNGQFQGNGQVPGNGQNGAVGGVRGFLGGGNLALTGKVTEVAADHLTLEVANGSSVTIAVDGSTTWHQQTAASTSDVKAGDSVIVQVQREGAAGGVGASPLPGQGGFTLGNAKDVTVTAP